MSLNFRKTKTVQDGFTIAEVLVAAGIFVVVLGIVVGGFTNGVQTQRKIASLIAVNNNASLVLEQIAREIRVGRDFCVDVNETDGTCISPIANFDPANSEASTPALEFRRLRGSQLAPVHYGWDGAQILRSEGTDVPSPITASNVKVSAFEFLVSNRIKPEYPWRITIKMRVSPTNAAPGEMEEDIQTTVSARFLPREDSVSPAIP